MTKQPINSQAGFTLIEVGMGALILVVGFIGLIEAVTIGTQMLDTARKQQIAAQIADGEIEWLRSQSATFIASTLANATITVDGDGTASPSTSANFILDDNASLRAIAKGFTVKLVKTAVTGRTATFTKVVYTVTWTGSSGRDYAMRTNNDADVTTEDANHMRTFEMYFERNGLRMSFQKS